MTANRNTILEKVILVTGPARSGKSEWAETLAMPSASVIYIATAKVDPLDAEWQSRLAKHRNRRPATWTTWEIPERLVESINTAPPNGCILIDSLGTWVANRLEEDDAMWENTVQNLCTSLKNVNTQIIIVAEETGWGVVPAYVSGRTFRDRIGNLTRRIGAIASEVYLVTGGYALNLTTLGSRLPAANHNLCD